MATRRSLRGFQQDIAVPHQTGRGGPFVFGFDGVTIKNPVHFQNVFKYGQTVRELRAIYHKERYER